MAATERERLATLLKKRAPDVEWADALESAIGRVIREWRTPEPLVDLEDVPDPGELRYLFRPLLVRDETNVWYADEQSLKSYLAMVCAASAASGVVVDGIGPPAITGPVVYYDWETFGANQSRRRRRVLNGLGLGGVRGIHYRRMTRPVVESAAMIRAEVSRLGAVLAVFDSLAWMCNGDLIKTEVALPAMNAVGSVQGVTRLVLAHHGKAGREGDPTVYGNAFFEAASRNRWLIKKSQEEGANVVRLGLYHKKGSDDERHPTQGLAFEFDRTRDAVIVAPCAVEDDPDLLKNASPAARIAAMLRQTEFCKAEIPAIASETGLSEAAVKWHLRRMPNVVNLNAESGGRSRRGVWALSATPQAPDRNGTAQATEETDKPIGPLSRELPIGFSPLRGETDRNRESQTDRPYRFAGEDDAEELPF
jgi:hypothetical protein